MMSLRFRIPDRMFVALSILTIAITWGMIWWVYPDLPGTIPIHYNLYGQPDSYGRTGFWMVAFPALIQTGLTLLFWWLYRHPQYSNIPSTVLITLMPEPIRSILFKLIRHMLVVLGVLINLLFAHLSLTSISIALGVSERLNIWLLSFILFAMLGSVALYSVWMYRIAKADQQQLQASPPESHA